MRRRRTLGSFRRSDARIQIAFEPLSFLQNSPDFARDCLLLDRIRFPLCLFHEFVELRSQLGKFVSHGPRRCGLFNHDWSLRDVTTITIELRNRRTPIKADKQRALV